MLTRGRKRRKTNKPAWRRLAKDGKYEDAFIELKKLAETGDAEAELRLGFVYYHGDFRQIEDKEKAVEWFMRARKHEHPYAIYITSSYRPANCFRENRTKKEKRITQNDPLVMAMACRFGSYGYNSMNSTYHWLKLCDNKDIWVLLYKSMNMYYRQRTFPSGAFIMGKNTKWLEKVAKMGFSDVQKELFLAYMRRDQIEDAYVWYRKLVRNKPGYHLRKKCGACPYDNCCVCVGLTTFSRRENAINTILAFILTQREIGILNKDIVSLIIAVLWRTKTNPIWDMFSNPKTNNCNINK